MMSQETAAKRALFAFCILIPAILIWWCVWAVFQNRSACPASAFWSGNRLSLVILLALVCCTYFLGIASRALALSLSVTTIFVWWFAAKQDWPKIGETFREARMLYILLSLVPMAVVYILRVFRWQILMRPVKRLSFWQSLGATLIHFTGNNVLPLRAGEFVRPAIVKVQYGGSFTATLATIGVERLLDLIALGIMLAFVCAFPPLSTAAQAESAFNAPKAALCLAAIVGTAVAFIVFLRFWPEKARSIVSTLMFPFPERIKKRALLLMDSFVIGLSFIGNVRHVVLTLLYSLVIWGMASASMYYSALAFSLNINYAGACFVLLCVGLAVALPQGPGFVGTFHFVAQWAVQMLGNPEAPAASFAIVAHAAAVIPVTVCGFVALWLMGLSLGRVREQAKKAKSEGIANS